MSNTAQAQITFKIDTDLKEKAFERVKSEGITLKALLTMAMREYVNNNFEVAIRPKEDEYFDPVFADPDVVREANKLGELMKKKNL